MKADETTADIGLEDSGIANGGAEVDQPGLSDLRDAVTDARQRLPGGRNRPV